ncbi:MAG TPA: hypothetical protein VFK88_11055 [Gallionella sp.]|nr:hypothetical protein [Gallionella sp.]
MNAGRIFSITIFALAGLLVGYAIFGRWGGEYVSLKVLFSFDGNPFQKAFRMISGIDDMRDKVLLCSAIGAVVGAFTPWRQKT